MRQFFENLKIKWDVFWGTRCPNCKGKEFEEIDLEPVDIHKNARIKKRRSRCLECQKEF